MAKEVPIGIDDFRNVIIGNYSYIDKTLLVEELIRKGLFKVTLIPRPRRFGKTLNMSMLKYFFENTDGSMLEKQEVKVHAHLFDGLAISKNEACMEHQGKYPVIFITFKDIKTMTWESCFTQLKGIIARSL